jgi:UDPglucose 6-dehydrogenase
MRNLVPIYEPGLEEMFLRNIQAKRLFSLPILRKPRPIRRYLLALPTPEVMECRFIFVLSVANQIGEMMTSYKVIVNKSTVPVGTADKVRE